MRHALRTGVLIALLCLVVPAAWADSVPFPVVAQYNVDGLLTITGNNACPPLSACAEKAHFSFGLDVINESNTGTGALFAAYVVPGSGTVESLGPLGQFTLLNGGLFNPSTNYVPLFDSNGDEIDLQFAQGTGTSPFVPSILFPYLYMCGTATCAADFDPTYSTYGLIRPGIFLGGIIEATITQVPEPQTLSLLLIGLAGVLALQLWRKSRYASG